MSQKKQASTPVKEEQILKLQDFVKKMGSVERARLAVEELARLKKSA